jgi:hypothetical protein
MSSRLALAALLLVPLLIGCEEESGLGVAEGRYRLQVAGAVTDTLAGTAVLRSPAPSRTGLELGARGEPGLSIEFTHAAPGAEEAAVASGRRYGAVQAALLDGPRPDSLSRLVAFLSLTDADFVATQGHFSVTHAGDGTVEGTVNLRMQERSPLTGAPRTVRVTGALRATSP